MLSWDNLSQIRIILGYSDTIGQMLSCDYPIHTDYPGILREFPYRNQILIILRLSGSSGIVLGYFHSRPDYPGIVLEAVSLLPPPGLSQDYLAFRPADSPRIILKRRPIIVGLS